MQLQKTLVILIVSLTGTLIVIAAVGAWLYFGMSQEAPPIVQEPVTTSTPQTPANNTPVTVQQPVVQEPVAGSTEVDPEKEYAALFESAGATKVVFTATASGEIYKLYTADIETLASSTGGYPLSIAMVDLNADKVPEAVVYEELPEFCGSGGCAIDVWQKNGNGWQKIFGGLGYETIGVTDSTTGGYKNLLISVHGDVGSMTKVMQYVFKDGTYQPWNLLAVWNGTTFAIPQ